MTEGAALQLANRKRIWDEYEKQRPKPGIEFDAFCEQLSSELKIRPRDVASMIAREANALKAQINRATETQAQIIANQLGADQVAAMTVLRNGLQATRSRPVYNPASKVIEEFKEPDWQWRIQAAHRILQIHASYAPMQYEVKGEVTHKFEELNEAQLLEEIKQLSAVLNGNGITIDVTSYAVEGDASRAVGPGESAPLPPQSGAGGNGHSVLVDRMHENERRAGQPAVVQALPAQAVRGAVSSSARSRAGGVRGKKQNDAGDVDGSGLGGASGVHSAGDESGVPERG